MNSSNTMFDMRGVYPATAETDPVRKGEKTISALEWFFRLAGLAEKMIEGRLSNLQVSIEFHFAYILEAISRRFGQHTARTIAMGLVVTGYAFLKRCDIDIDSPRALKKLDEEIADHHRMLSMVLDKAKPLLEYSEEQAK